MQNRSTGILFVAVAAAAAASLASWGCAREPDDRFAARAFEDSTGTSLPYRLFVPQGDDPASRYPLVLFLHGGAGAGTDNISQISGGNRAGSHVWIDPDVRARHPAFVVAPQLPGMGSWAYPGSPELSRYGAAAVALVEQLVGEHAIDRARIYVTGQSRGGWGVWDLIGKRPDLFAAGVPVCGGGDAASVAAASEVAVWAFHGARDRTVPVEGARALVEALRAAGGEVRYTEYDHSGHAIWNRAYGDDDLVEWLFGQRKADAD